MCDNSYVRFLCYNYIDIFVKYVPNRCLQDTHEHEIRGT